MKKARSSVAGTTISSFIFMSCFSEVIYDDGDVSKKKRKKCENEKQFDGIIIPFGEVTTISSEFRE